MPLHAMPCLGPASAMVLLAASCSDRRRCNVAGLGHFFGLLLLLLLRPWTSLLLPLECSTSSFRATTRCASPRCVAPRCSAPRHASPRRATSRRAAPRRASPRRALLRHAMCLAFRFVLPFGALASRCGAAGVWDGHPYLRSWFLPTTLCYTSDCILRCRVGAAVEDQEEQ